MPLNRRDAKMPRGNGKQDILRPISADCDQAKPYVGGSRFGFAIVDLIFVVLGALAAS
jgi:hypothetical protein